MYDGNILRSEAAMPRQPLADPTVMVSRPSGQPAEAGGLDIKLQGAGVNPLVDAAGVLLVAMTRLRSLPEHEDPAHLRLLLVNELRSFEAALDQHGYGRAIVMAARYCLCAAVDEAVLATPWGSSGDWSAKSLLSTFHNETWGGEKVFMILGRVMEEPARHRDLLEFLYICLRLGFEGRYNIMENGRAKLDLLMENVYATIRPQRGEFDPALSAHWQGTEKKRRRLRPILNGHWLLILSLVVIAGLYTVHLNRLHDQSRQLLDRFDAALRVETVEAR